MILHHGASTPPCVDVGSVFITAKSSYQSQVVPRGWLGIKAANDGGGRLMRYHAWPLWWRHWRARCGEQSNANRSYSFVISVCTCGSKGNIKESGVFGVCCTLFLMEVVPSWYRAMISQSCYHTVVSVTLIFRFDLRSLWCPAECKNLLLPKIVYNIKWTG